MAKARQQEYVSILPEDMVQGGLIDDADVTFQNCRYAVYDFNGSVPGGRVCLRVEMVDESGDIHEQYFSAASPEHFAPSDDECHLTAVGEKKSLNKGSNFEAFIASLLEEGLPGPRLRDEGSAALDGIKAHVIRKPAPERKGLINPAGGARGDRPQTQLVVSKILEAPWLKGGKAAGKAAGTAAAAGTRAASKPNGKVKEEEPEETAAVGGEAPEVSDTDMALMTTVGELVEKKALSLKELAMGVFKSVGATERRTAPKRCVEADFLEAGEAMGLWSYDASKGTVGPAA